MHLARVAPIAICVVGWIAALPTLAAGENLEPAHWFGIVELKSDYIVPAGARLIVEEGTAIRPAVGVAPTPKLVIDGEAELRGSEASPIRLDIPLQVGPDPGAAVRLGFVVMDAVERGWETACAFHVQSGDVVVEDSRFTNMSRAVCIEGGSAEFIRTTFLLNGHVPYEGLHRCDFAASQHENEEGTGCGPASNGARCWTTERGTMLCRGAGERGAAIVVSRGKVNISHSHFGENARAVHLVGEAEAVISHNAFVGNGVAGLSIQTNGTAPRLRTIIVEKNEFRRHGEAASHAPLIPEGPAAIIVAGTRIDPSPMPQNVTWSVVVQGNVLEDNRLGVHVIGDAAPVLFERETIAGNRIGILSTFGRIRIESSTLANQDLDLWLEGDVGRAELRNTTFDAGKVRVEGEGIIEHDSGVIRAAGIAAAGLATAVSLFGTLTEAGRWLALKTILAGYARVRRPQLLAHPIRERLHARIFREPGVHLRALAREAGSYGAAVHHLSRLEDEGLIRSARDGLRRRFYPPGTGPKTFDGLAPLAERIREAAVLRPGLNVAALARQLGKSRQIVHYHVEALTERGMLLTRRERGQCLIYPPGPGASLERSHERRQM